MPEFFTIQEVSKALKVTVRTLYRWNDAGKITFIKVGQGRLGRLRISKEELAKFIGIPAQSAEG